MSVVSSEARPVGLPTVIAEGVRDLIIRGVLSPGVHLGQMQLAAQFEASRVPVREALKLLAAEGLISHDPNRGFFVLELSSEEARQLYRIRHILERELLLTIPWPHDEQSRELTRLVDDIDAALKGGDRLTWIAKHRQFHQKIFDLSPDKILVREIQRLWTLTDRYRSLLPTPEPKGGSDDRSLVEALMRQDRHRLLDVFERERQEVEQRLLRTLSDRGL